MRFRGFFFVVLFLTLKMMWMGGLPPSSRQWLFSDFRMDVISLEIMKIFRQGFCLLGYDFLNAFMTEQFLAVRQHFYPVYLFCFIVPISHSHSVCYCPKEPPLL